MPFDALVAPAQPKPLLEVLADHGVTPVSLELLEAHKRAQLERFAPSFWYRHQPLLPAALLGSVGCMAATGGLTQRMVPGGSPLSGWLTLAWMCVIGLLIAAGVFRVRAGSHWEERWVPADWLPDLGVPEPIALLAARSLPQGARVGADPGRAEAGARRARSVPAAGLRWRAGVPRHLGRRRHRRLRHRLTAPRLAGEVDGAQRRG